MRVAVVGAGISGLTVARRLVMAGAEAVVYEREQGPGGIARVEQIEGVPYHRVGGHCFNSKYREMVDFVDGVMPLAEHFHHLQRDARILLRGAEIGYPIELNLRPLARAHPELAARALEDFLAADRGPADDLATWFRRHFGETLADAYFIPYSDKIWGRPCAELTPEWVADKLPLPDRDAVLASVLRDDGADAMPHRTFYYPKAGSQQAMIDRLADGLDARYGATIEALEPQGGGWRVAGERYDHVVSTVPLPLLPRLVPGGEAAVGEPASRLRYNRVSNVLWETDGAPRGTWTYVPGDTSIHHRHVHIGAWLRPQRPYTITEVIGDVPAERIIEDGRRHFPYLKRPVASHVSDHAYVVFDRDYRPAREAVLRWARDVGVHTLGRFGEWEYYNMDICMRRAHEVASELVGGS